MLIERVGTVPLPTVAPGAGCHRPGGVASTYQEVPAVPDRTRAHHDPAELPELQAIPLARDLTTSILEFVRDRATPIAEWVTWTGGEPELVLVVVTETLHTIAEGLEGDAAPSDSES